MKGSWNSTIVIPTSLTFLFLLFTYNFDDVFAAPSRHLCRPEHRDALLEFKNEFEILNSSFVRPCYIDGNIVTPHPKTESWVNNNDCCNWEGITCNAKSGKVIELNLTCSCLHGPFHSSNSLQNLHFLTTLDLSYNNISGQIPSSIGNLSQLTSLDLSNSKFVGWIPTSIGKLSLLTTLDLSYNNFVGQIPTSLGNFSQLTSLDLSHNDFDGQILFPIEKFSRLTSLNLSYNRFYGHFPSSIGNLSQLTSLHLSYNDFDGQIPSSIGKLSQLTSLDLSSNNFIGKIPSSFGNLNQLISFLVASNNLNGKFPIVLLNLIELSSLSISNNQFTGTLPPDFSSLSNLAFFNVRDNAFTGTPPSSLFDIPSMRSVLLNNNQFNGTLEFGNISSPSKLQVLQVGNNNFRGPISSSISKLTNLSVLDLSHFNTQGPIDFSIFSHLKGIEHLDLSHLNTTTMIDLNDILSFFKNLSSLDLSGNHVSSTHKSSVSNPPSQVIMYMHLSGCGITYLPEILRTQQLMVTLDISNNKINGQVPNWLWALPQLGFVDLSNNTFTSFENSAKSGQSTVMIPYIEHLFGSNNNFTGKIPSFICALRSLVTLDLSNNNFNGSIPRCLGNLNRTLSVLNLSQNRLRGGLLENIFERLRSLNVGHNQLMGKLPRSLIRQSSLEVLNVESNRINDTFPFWLSSLQKLQVLILRSNAFHGPIHQAPFPKLKIIDISHNHFNGNLASDYFVQWSAMSSLGTNEDRSNQKYIGDGTGYYHDSLILMNKGVEMGLVRILKIYTALDFSGNIFEGEIPKSVGLLKELHVLNLSNNAFTGHIPSSMGNLTALESLDVSVNQLSGEIPQELGSLSFLSYMNFSDNHLAGRVPGGTQFRRQNCSSFKDNIGLFGPSLDEICRDIHTPVSPQPHETPEEDEEVLNWIAAAIGFIPGIVFGLTIGYILGCYRPHWCMIPFGRNKR